MSHRPKNLAIKDKVLNQLGIDPQKIVLEIPGVVYEGGRIGYSPDTSLFSTAKNEGNLIITKEETYFIIASFFSGSLKHGFSIPHNSVKKEEIDQQTGNLMNTQKTLAATAGLGSIGLAAGAYMKATRVQIPFSEDGLSHKPVFMFRKGKDCNSFVNTFLRNLD